ncbi:unnamed protein product [Rangifer tarandus platyrhynchus]|uniref:Uncharacterized protein n=1 Tax=Rangifer tarandus platyrhynchus TaxID=3082113 RepID=A0ABN8ZDQ1_RANTA|nr:unnamed protein product [Rangifer tarandus platyrhynchus]
MPQDLMKQGGEEASHHGQRRRPPPHRQARPSAPPGGLSATPRPQVGSQVSPAHHAGAGCGTQGGHLTSPSPRSRLLPARLQPPGRESCKPAHCRVRRSATAQGPARGESAVQRGTQNASGSRPCRQRSDLATSRVTDAILDGESQGSGSQVVLPAARGGRAACKRRSIDIMMQLLALQLYVLRLSELAEWALEFPEAILPLGR